MAKQSRWRPAWTYPFIEEPADIEDIEETKRGLPWAAIAIFILFGASLAAEIVTLINDTSKLHIALVALTGFSKLWTAIFRPRTSSAVLSLITPGVIAAQAFSIISNWNNDDTTLIRNLGSINLALNIVIFIILLNLPFRPSWRPQLDISKPYTEPTNSQRSPEDNLTLWQWMTFSWMAPLISIGSKRKLEETDVWQLAYEFQHRHLHNAFRELKGSVIMRLLRANWIDLAILCVLAFVELAATYSSPLILQKLLQAMQNVQYDKESALKYAALILVVELVETQSNVFSLWFGRRTYERSRGEMITMLYEKTLNRKIVSGVKDKEKEMDGDAAAGATNGDATKQNGVSDDDQAVLNPDDEPPVETTALLGGTNKPPPGKRFLSRILSPLFSIFTAKLFKKKKQDAEEKGPASMGKILNLMKNDVYEIAQRFWEVQTLLKVPIGFVLSIVLCWRIMGPAVLLGVAVLVVSQLLSVVFARILRNREKERRKHTDDRLQRTSQYIEAIRHLRWYGWHPHWMSKIISARQSELNWRIIVALWGMVVWIINALGSDIMIFATFLGYTTILGKELRIDVAFPALELLYMLQDRIRGLPDLVVIFLNANVAINRIEDFMKEPDKEENEKIGNGPTDHETSMKLVNASFAWPGLTSNVLKNVNLTAKPGLHVVSGPVASGKSALLKALLGELDLTDGQLISHDGAVGYCAQNPWLQSMSIRDNIVFTSEYEEERYRKTVEACALLPDFANFKDGDQSAIGENGIGLSGGQKARVALARAVYSQAQVLMLDDPLSALDQQTAEFIVEKCLRSELVKHRTVILVTHRLDLVRGIADQRIHMMHGEAHVNEEVDEEAENELALEQTKTKEEAADTTGIQGDKKADKFEDEEKRAVGEVKLAVYWEYIKSGNVIFWLGLLFAGVACRFFTLAETWYVKEWGEAYGEDQPRLFIEKADAGDTLHAMRSSSNPFDRAFDSWPDPAVNVLPWLYGLLFIVVMQSVMVTLYRASMMGITYSSGKSMFGKVMMMVSGTTFHYYDVTPVGRLMNRLTSDIGTIDGGIVGHLFGFTWSILSWFSSIAIIMTITPLFLLISIALSSLFVIVFRRYLPTSQSLRRLEAASLSPLMSNFGALLEGLMTVRAFCAQTQFQEQVFKVVDKFQSMDHMYWQNQGWLSYRYGIMSTLSTFLLTITAVYSGLSPGLTAFALVAAAKFVQATNGLCRTYGMLQLDFVAVERVVELLHLDQEPTGNIEPPASWPSYKSDIVFENVTMRYAPHLEPALVDVSCRLPGGSTTAIIGRTGSGKSTLALSLLATLAPEKGRILVDGIDIFKVDKRALRSRITFLAQEPVLFPGTLRHNLDPTEERSESECESVLTRISGASDSTSTLVGGAPWTLSTEVDTGGKNLSHGQRQLVGLARAILRRSAIVIMDEATASIDQATAWEVQRLLKEELSMSTVLTIAHRAEAVHGVENCIVLGKGRVIRQGSMAEMNGGPSGDATEDSAESSEREG